MATILEATPISELEPEEFDNAEHYEIVDGVRVEMPPMSADSQVLAFRIARCLSNYGIEKNIGEACMEVLFKLPLPVDRNRKPDAAFVPYSRWAKNRAVPTTNAWEVLPDLCVEVVSPHDLGEEIETKVVEYLQSGVRLVWVVYPRHARVYVYESQQLARRLGRTETLDGGPVLPGFQLPLIELFPEPPA